MTVLLTTIHDPKGMYLKIKNLEKTLNDALSNYEKSYANVTRSTHPKIKEIAKKNFNCVITGEGTLGEHMITLVRQAKGKKFHCCDFDRLIHWQMKYPEELKKTTRKLEKSRGFVFICRTKRAFSTHPNTQMDTESVMNMMISKYIGMEVDMGSGTFGFDNSERKSFASIKGNIRDVRFLGHFLVRLKKYKIHISKIEVEGMEWETPDVHQEKIKNIGYQKWLLEFQSHREWRKRVDYISQVAEIIYKKN